MLEHRIQKREFLSTPSARRATLSLLSMAVSGRAFLSTPSARRATAAHPPLLRIHAISIHALREEGDPTVGYMAYFEYIFLSTPSARRATAGAMQMTAVNEFLSTPSARRATAPPSFFGHSGGYFYPRPPRGGRLQCSQSKRLGTKFLSTPSARRATPRPDASIRRQKNFYPRPPRGGRQLKTKSQKRKIAFLSTPSARRATFSRMVCRLLRSISIHALREEGDSKNRDKISIFL